MLHSITMEQRCLLLVLLMMQLIIILYRLHTTQVQQHIKLISLRGTYTTAWSLSFNNDGTKLFIVDGDSTDAIYEYSLSTAYDLSNLTLESSRTGLTTYPTGHFF